ncbi:hypothetical protein [Wolbachia endosymbiont of Onchocerca gibsoni]|uniref:hypothetical protein n=1 Tax=Wolbachia endosymbiont of Onchocerca gibsoni TaxID=118986 RepID=UPI0023D7E0BD|nr:hypothetical protein [Wolbachia endosymbiont of Onchocerca gibsoni]
MSRNSIIFKIDNKNLFYKKLIKLSTMYCRLKKNGNICVINLYVGMVEGGTILMI